MQVQLLLVALGLLWQMQSAKRLPLLVRLLVWPLLLFEGWLAMLSAAVVTQPLLDSGTAGVRDSSAASERDSGDAAVKAADASETLSSAVSGAAKTVGSKGGRTSTSPAKARPKVE